MATPLSVLRERPINLGDTSEFTIKIWLNTAKRQADQGNREWEQAKALGPNGGKRAENAYIAFKEFGHCLQNVMRHPKLQSMLQEKDPRGNPGPDLTAYNQLKLRITGVSQTNNEVITYLEKRDAALEKKAASEKEGLANNGGGGGAAYLNGGYSNGSTPIGSAPMTPSSDGGESLGAIIDGYTKASPITTSTSTFPSSPSSPAPTPTLAERMAALRQAGMSSSLPSVSPKSSSNATLGPAPPKPAKPANLQASRTPPGSPRTMKRGDLVEDSAAERSGSAPPIIPLSEQQRGDDWEKAKGSWNNPGETLSYGEMGKENDSPRLSQQPTGMVSPSLSFGHNFPSLDELESRGFPDSTTLSSEGGVGGYSFPSAPNSDPSASPPAIRRSLPAVPKPFHMDQEEFDRGNALRAERMARVASNASTRAPLPTPSRPAPSPSSLPPLQNPLSTIIRHSAVPLSPRSSQLPAAPNNSEPTSYKIPYATEVLPKFLFDYLSTAFSATKQGPRVLLLDVRSREEYTKARVFGEAVCIEPITLRNGVTSEGIESSLSISPPAEAALFAARDRYDMVIIYDRSSSSIPTSAPPSTGSEAQKILWNLTNAIYEREFHKSLKRQPMLLKGGWEAWERDIGSKGIVRQGQDPEVGNEPSALSRSDAVKVSNRRAVVSPNGTQPTLRNGASTVPLAPSLPSSPPAVAPTAGYFSPMSSYGSSYGGNGGMMSPTLALPPVAAARSGSTATYEYNSLASSQSSGGFRPSYPQPHINGLASPPPNSSSPAIANGGFQRGRNDYGDLGQSYSASPYNSASPRGSIDEYPNLRAPAVIQSSRPPPNSQVPPVIPPVPLARPAAVQPAPLRSSSSFSGSSITPYTNGNSARFQSYLKFGDEAIGLTGLKNLGNTCYMNSTIQCLSATIPFARYFKEGGYRRDINMINPLGTKGALSNAVAELIRAIWAQDYMFLSPNTFRENICRVAPQFRGTDQHDAQEFLGFLLDGLHEDLNYILHKPKPIEMTPDREHDLETLPQQVMSEREWMIYTRRNDSFVVRYFQGQFRNQLKCLTCSKTSTTYNTFMPLSVPIPHVKGNAKVSLLECIEAFVREEIMDKDDAWNCPRCKVRRKASKRLTLSRLPPILIIHLKRFSFKGPFSDKLETRVQYPLNGLDLTNYLPPPIFDKRAPAMTAPPRGYVYDLYGVTNHYGNLSSGHYTAYVRNHQEWNNIGDSKVTPIDASTVQEGKQAYILFYRLRVP